MAVLYIAEGAKNVLPSALLIRKALVALSMIRKF